MYILHLKVKICQNFIVFVKINAYSRIIKEIAYSSIHIIYVYMYMLQARYLELGEAADLDGLYEQPLHGQVVALDGLPHLAARLGGHGWEVTDLQGPAVVILRYVHAQAEHWGRKEIYIQPKH